MEGIKHRVMAQNNHFCDLLAQNTDFETNGPKY